jgi:hypothetical protein
MKVYSDIFGRIELISRFQMYKCSQYDHPEALIDQLRTYGDHGIKWPDYRAQAAIRAINGFLGVVKGEGTLKWPISLGHLP